MHEGFIHCLCRVDSVDTYQKAFNYFSQEEEKDCSIGIPSSNISEFAYRVAEELFCHVVSLGEKIPNSIFVYHGPVEYTEENFSKRFDPNFGLNCFHIP